MQKLNLSFSENNLLWSCFNDPPIIGSKTITQGNDDPVIGARTLPTVQSLTSTAADTPKATISGPSWLQTGYEYDAFSTLQCKDLNGNWRTIPIRKLNSYLPKCIPLLTNVFL